MLCIFKGMYCRNHISATHYPDFHSIIKGTMHIKGRLYTLQGISDAQVQLTSANH